MKYSIPDFTIPEPTRSKTYYGKIFVVMACDPDSETAEVIRKVRFTREAAADLARLYYGTYYEKVLVIPEAMLVV